MLLRPQESVLRSAYAVLESAEASGGEGGPGVLYLTNRRVAFESQVSRGPLRDLVDGRETRLVVDANLPDVRNVTIRRGRVRSPRIVLDLGAHRPAFDVLDPDGWLAAIALARREHPTTPPPLTSELRIVEREVVKLRCRYCGALGHEAAGRCPSCGAPL